jgi:hypothetical protein
VISKVAEKAWGDLRSPGVTSLDRHAPCLDGPGDAGIAGSLQTFPVITAMLYPSISPSRTACQLSRSGAQISPPLVCRGA